MARLSFAIALNLITDGFRRGTTQVKSGMASIKSSVMSTAAYFGIGFAGVGAIFSKLKAAALDFAKAQKQLNVSSGGSIAGLQNLQMLKKVASDTGQEITSLMSTYAKFTATATANGYAVSEQQKIFQNVSKAVKGYKLSDEEQAVVMGSLNRMMTQGQVSTKNFTNTMLRAMPQAKTAMAAALGVGVDQLTAIIKKGVDAKKVLGTFAGNLGRQAPQVDTNTLAGQQARRQNAFTDLANTSGVVNALKQVNKVAADVMEYIRGNARTLVTEVIGLIAGIKIASFWAQWKVYSAESSAAMVNNATMAHARVRGLENQTAALKRTISKQETALAAASADERLAIEVQLRAKKEALLRKETMLSKEQNVMRVADERAAAVQTGTAWQVAWVKIQTGAEALGVRLKVLWSTIGPMILITAITELGMRIYTVIQQAGALKREWDDYKKGAREAVHTQEIAQLESMRNLVTQRGASEKQVRNVMDDINSRYGTHIKNEKDLISWINKRTEALRDSAAAEYYTRKQLEYQDKLDEIYARHGGSQKGLDKDQKAQGGTVKDAMKYMLGWAVGEHSTATDYSDAAALSHLLAKAQKDAEKYVGLSVSRTNYDYSGYTPEAVTKDKKEDPAREELEGAEKQYAKTLLEISEKEKLQLITASAADKARQELVESMLVQTAASQYSSVRESEFAKGLGAKYKEMQGNRALTSLNEYTEEYNTKLKNLSTQFNAGAITQEEYARSIMDLISSAKKETALFTDIDGANKAYVEAMMGFSMSLGAQASSISYGDTKKYNRDTTYDYKKESTGILGEELDKAKEKLEDLKSGALKQVGSLQEQINAQMANVTSLSEALKVAELKKDVKDLKKDLLGDVFKGISSIAEGSNRIVEAWTQLGETLNSSDATGWEKIYAIWQALSESVSSIVGMVDAINTWTKASDALKLAKEKEAATTVAANAMKDTSNATSATVATTAAIVETASNKKAVAGNIAVAGSEVVKNNSKIPIVGIALAAAGLIAVLALMSQLPKFAGGGVMSGGALTGDLNLARINSGEMILNGTQQQTLFKAIDSNRLGGGGSSTLTTKFRGSDMYIVLSNYLKKTGKKL